ncbi:eukaryotic translation initiation factor 4E-like isoform X1 [Ostrea edulis]|uniref:eukaryotic translation initiation factor 4E-like isoform X1 n=1 Tax=Ostrea edulis TaxID=37623 RepID=UPI002096441D|nr:eukaryotic translation initiation factor 4E-like isoform X1 [Ostrea edulis]
MKFVLSLHLSKVMEERVEEEEDEPTDDGAIISPDALIKHPLQNKWALWFFKNDRTKEWTANLKLITAFDTVEDFWGLYNHVQKASKLPSGCDYSLFKDGVQPMWEDERNKDGGRWLINLNKNQRQTDLDNFWLETLLCLIGESFEEYSEDICGAVVNIRNKGDKLSLWTKEASRPDAILKIGKKLKERLSIPPKIQIGFQAHTDTMTKTGSTAKDRFRV